MKKLLLTVLLTLSGFAATSYAQYILRPMTVRYSNPSQKGNIVYAANSIVNAGFAPQTTENPPAGTGKNNGQVANHVDVDGDPTTTNSSTSDLSLASCTNVLFAGLYWGCGVGGNTGAIPAGGSTNDTAWISAAFNTCQFKLPGGAYQTITATQADKFNQSRIQVGTPAASTTHSGYLCFADVTSLITALASPNGTYAVANVVSPVGNNGAGSPRRSGYGGWTLVIVYSDPTLQVRNLTVFDGCVVTAPAAGNVDVTVSGFLTPPVGPVSCELGAVVIDGDRQDGNESFQFRQGGAIPFVDLTRDSLIPGNQTSRLNDAWNSSIAHRGVVTTTRNPAYLNTYGYDSKIFELYNPLNANLGNNQTNATVRFNGTVETYTLQVLTTSITNFNPVFRFDKTATDVNGGALDPGDIIRYQVNYRNVGNDGSTNTIITDNLPANTLLVPGSIRINGTTRTEAIDLDQADYVFATNQIRFRIGTGANNTNGGVVPPGTSGNVTFDVYTPSSCRVVSCMGPITNSARIDFGGVLSGGTKSDSSSVDVSGCLIKGPVSNTLTLGCYNPVDTLLRSVCPRLKIALPVSKYAGYTFYNSLNFIPANVINPYDSILSTSVVYAYYNAGPGCSDTIEINLYINGCPDIDDDNDGITDYVEVNNPQALLDHDSDGIPNWRDNTHPNWTDHNLDGSNDFFDPAADSDNDGIPNFYDTGYPGYTDSNGDAVNDNFDKDLDGIPNIYDLDSDNDGIPDTAEGFGVDANGDGRIDNYSDTDNDGLSQNVDASNTGISNSANGLANLFAGVNVFDLDGDGIPNYLDLDSDNDGIPDITEAFGTDAANSAKVNVFADTDGDGYADALDADVGNDMIAENSGSALLRTSADANSDGRTDSWPNKNMEGDSKPNPYDLDSDGDGISDVKEAQLTDADWNGQVDGAINTNGRNTALAALPALSIPNTDGVGRTNPYDIDADEDGIPDNVEGLTTLGYLLPAAADTDNDGIDNRYDNVPASFGGDGIHPCDTDGDSTPDYLDGDTDSDGRIDRIEGNDLNLNGLADDNITLTGTDTDGDGLDNRFDANNSSVEATSARMGNGGTTSGDPTPGSITTVQHTVVTWGCPTERDWRCLPYVLSCEFIAIKAVLNNEQATVQWEALCRQEVEYFVVERSSDRINFTAVGTTLAKPALNEVNQYHALDNVAGVNNEIFFYRVKAVAKSGRVNYSAIVLVRRQTNGLQAVQILPNPAQDYIQLLVKSKLGANVSVHITDAAGSTLFSFREKILAGNNTLTYRQVASLPSGTYYLRVFNDELNEVVRFHVIK